MTYPNTYRGALAGYNAYGRGAEGSVTFAPPNLVDIFADSRLAVRNGTELYSIYTTVST